MIGIAKKQTSEAPQLVRALSEFSRNYYGEDSDGRLHAFFSLVEDLRREVSIDLPYDQALRTHEEYLHALDLIEDRFPWGEDRTGVNVQTTWFNHLAKKFTQAGWLSGGGVKSDSTTMCSVPFERACVVFNIGALTALAGHRSEDNKTAIQQFQRAAAIFQITRDQLLPQVSGTMTCDLSPAGMNLCSSLCLAHGQQRFYTQAVDDGLPATLLAKLANQVAEFFDAAVTCTKQMEGAISPEYRQQFTNTTGLYRARAEYHQASAQKATSDKEMTGFGSCVRRYKVALELANLAKLAFEGKDEASAIGDLIQEIQQGLQQVESDNDNVYMEMVPAANMMPAIGKVATVKVQPDMTFEDVAREGTEVAKYTELLDRLLPEEVNEFLQDFHIRVESLVASIDDDSRAQTKEIEETMHMYNLPFCLDVASEGGIPENLWTKIHDVQTRGGVAALNGQLQGLNSADQAVRNLIQEVRKLLTEEEKADEEVRERFRGRWTRLPSSNTNRTFFTHLQQTEAQLRQVQEALPQLNNNVQALQMVAKLLDKTQSEVEQSLPAPADIPQDSKQVVAVRSALDNLLKETTNAQTVADKCRAEILEFAIEGHLLHAHQSGYSMETVINEKINELDSYRRDAAQSLSKLQNFLGSLRNAFERFQQTQEGRENPRVKALSDLDNKAQTVLQIYGDIQDRTNYYYRIQGYLQNLQKQVSEYVFARNQEKTGLLSNITAQIANPDVGFQGVVIEEFGLGSLGIKISYDEGKGWKVTEVKPDGEVARKGWQTRIAAGAMLICIDDYDLRNEPDISSVLENPRGHSRKVVFIPSVAQGAPPPGPSGPPIIGGGFPSAPPMY